MSWQWIQANNSNLVLSFQTRFASIVYLVRNSWYSCCFRIPVFIMILWKHGRSTAQSLHEVKAGNHTNYNHSMAAARFGIGKMCCDLTAKPRLDWNDTKCILSWQIKQVNLCLLLLEHFNQFSLKFVSITKKNLYNLSWIHKL